MKRPISSLRNLLLLAALSGFVSTHAAAMFMMPQPTPIDRLIARAEAYRAKHPNEAQAHYTLARIHYLAFHLKRDQVPAFGGEANAAQPPQVAPQWMLAWSRDQKKGGELPDASIAEHAAKALKGFNEALRLNPKDGLTQLGIASLKEEFAGWSKSAKGLVLPPELVGITVNQVREAYAKALSISIAEDSKLKHLPLAGIDSITSYEAATALIRLSKVETETLTDAGRRDVEAASKAVEKFKSLQMSAVTPMVFSLQPAARLDDLLAPEVIVDFDLRGYGFRERWPWMKPSLGLLVWDPLRNGDIRSARQLFGGYTFEIFRANGYDALDALDDDGDGALTNTELDGVSAWFDRNSDGVSSPEEVKPLCDLGVAAVAVRMESHDGIHPTNARGITLRDGRTVRTWDWIVQPVQERRSLTPLPPRP